MKNTLKKAVLDSAGILIFVTVLSFALGLSSYLLRGAPTIVGKFHADRVLRGDKYVEAHITGEKSLECLYVLDSERGFARVEGYWTPIDFEYKGKKKGNRSVGFQNFGVWRWSSNNMNNVTDLAITVVHTCNQNGEEYLRSSVIGPFSLPKISE